MKLRKSDIAPITICHFNSGKKIVKIIVSLTLLKRKTIISARHAWKITTLIGFYFPLVQFQLSSLGPLASIMGTF